MRIFISSDHGGFELKQTLFKDLQNHGYTVTDLGPATLTIDDDYPPYAFNLAKEVVNPDKTEETLGILICRSGNGMVIAANKVKGARAALCFSQKHAQKARADDDANILCLDSDYVEGDSPLDIVLAFLETEFAGWDTRHGRRVTQIIEFEEESWRE